jgi:hypothetical protein
VITTSLSAADREPQIILPDLSFSREDQTAYLIVPYFFPPLRSSDFPLLFSSAVLSSVHDWRKEPASKCWWFVWMWRCACISRTWITVQNTPQVSNASDGRQYRWCNAAILSSRTADQFCCTTHSAKDIHTYIHTYIQKYISTSK